MDIQDEWLNRLKADSFRPSMLRISMPTGWRGDMGDAQAYLSVETGAGYGSYVVIQWHGMGEDLEDLHLNVRVWSEIKRVADRRVDELMVDLGLRAMADQEAETNGAS